MEKIMEKYEHKNSLWQIISHTQQFCDSIPIPSLKCKHWKSSKIVATKCTNFIGVQDSSLDFSNLLAEVGIFLNQVLQDGQNGALTLQGRLHPEGQ